jgi:hypothetical protein
MDGFLSVIASDEGERQSRHSNFASLFWIATSAEKPPRNDVLKNTDGFLSVIACPGSCLHEPLIFQSVKTRTVAMGYSLLREFTGFAEAALNA